MDVRAIELLSADRGQVLLIGDIHLQAEETGLEFRSPLGMLAALRGEKIVMVRFFLDLEEARAAAGLA